MLSSAQKSVPTTKQFRQPYFMDIAPDGVILSTCSRVAALLERRNTLHYDIPASMATGQSIRDLIPYDLSSAGKKSYLICSIHYVRDHNRQVTEIMALNRDVTEVKLNLARAVNYIPSANNNL